jgi:hypothetical protein
VCASAAPWQKWLVFSISRHVRRTNLPELCDKAAAALTELSVREVFVGLW